jgi:hypothetical protein
VCWTSLLSFVGELASMLKLFDLKKKKDEGKDDPGAGSAGEPLLVSPRLPSCTTPHSRCSPFTSGMLAGRSLCSRYNSPAVTSLPLRKHLCLVVAARTLLGDLTLSSDHAHVRSRTCVLSLPVEWWLVV